MSAAKHTPPPWVIHGALLGYRGDVFSPTAKNVKDCHHIARCFAPKPAEPVICELQEIQVTRDAVAIIEANARLIAAAPDYRAARDSLFAAIEHGDEAHRTWLKEAIDAHFAAADAKATGAS